MMPIAFNENNSLFLNNETAVVLVLLIILCIAGTAYNILTHNSEKSFLQKSVIHQIVLSILATISFAVFIDYANQEKSQVEQLMLVQIQEKYNVENLQPVEQTSIFCDDNYTQSINSMVWTEKDETKQIGVLIGKKVDNQCRFILEETVEKDPLKKLRND